MDWAYDAAQSRYKFMPHQSQLETIAQWVGMEHMHPSVVKIPFPGLRAEDTFEVTTFDFISLFHSSKILFCNTLPLAPDGRLGECLSGSW
jgi:hypothetical protein